MKLLVGLDLRDAPEALVPLALSWAEPLEMTVSLGYARPVPTAIPSPDAHPDDVLAQKRQWDADRAALEAVEQSIPAKLRGAIHLADGDPAQNLAEWATDHDVVAVGTHGRRGFAHWWLGSVAEKVVRTATTPVLVLKNPLPQRPRVIVALDVRIGASAFLDTVLPWLTRIDAVADLLYVEEGFIAVDPTGAPILDSALQESWAQVTAERASRVKQLLERIPAQNRGSAHVMSGRASDVIAERASDADLVILGTHGRTGIPRFVLGSVAERTLRRSPVSTLVLRVTE